MGEQEVTGASTDINVEKERERERERSQANNVGHRTDYNGCTFWLIKSMFE